MLSFIFLLSINDEYNETPIVFDTNMTGGGGPGQLLIGNEGLNGTQSDVAQQQLINAEITTSAVRFEQVSAIIMDINLFTTYCERTLIERITQAGSGDGGI